MNTAELTKEIREKHPKTWEALCDKYYCYKKGLTLENNIWVGIGIDNEFIIHSEYEDENYLLEQYSPIPFPMLYGLLDKFFREYGIMFYEIFYGLVNAYGHRFSDEDYEKFQAQTVLIASEILEERLNQISTQETN